MRYLMINADDFGMCHAMNAATIGLLEDNLITSATLMPPCPWFVEAVQYAASHPEKCVGVHLTLTSEWELMRWGPVAKTSLPSLVTNGYFPKSSLEVEQHARKSEVEIELRAQLELVKTYGLDPSHIDNHMGSLYGWQGIQSFLPLAFKLCQELSLPFRFPKGLLTGDAITESLPKPVLDKLSEAVALANAMNVPLVDYIMAPEFAKSEGETYDGFRDDICKKLAELPDGITEFIVHPSLDTPEIRAINPHWEKRVWEERLCRDEVFISIIKQEKLELITWREVAALSKNKL
jgi:chitin disaccharide deacetylase